MTAPLGIVTWKWTPADGRPAPFSAVHVNALRRAIERHVHLPFRMFCVTDDPAGIDPEVTIVPLPTTFAHTPRCRRRMQQFDRAFGAQFGDRMLSIDLDVVIVDDLTPLLRRSEPIVGWKIEYANVYSGSFLMFDVGALHGLWRQFMADPEGYPRRAWPRGVGSDQAMLNYYLARRPPIGTWTAADGMVTFFGAGYERFEHYGVGPRRPDLPAGARIVVLGSADLHVLDEPERYPWVKAHWLPYAAEVTA